jgi:hypothetical protein
VSWGGSLGGLKPRSAARRLARSVLGSRRPAGATKKEKRAAAARMLEAVARIAGAGALSFAQDAVVRAQFVALKPQKKD